MVVAPASGAAAANGKPTSKILTTLSSSMKTNRSDEGRDKGAGVHAFAETTEVDLINGRGKFLIAATTTTTTSTGINVPTTRDTSSVNSRGVLRKLPSPRPFSLSSG